MYRTGTGARRRGAKVSEHSIHCCQETHDIAEPVAIPPELPHRCDPPNPARSRPRLGRPHAHFLPSFLFLSLFTKSYVSTPSHRSCSTTSTPKLLIPTTPRPNSPPFPSTGSDHNRPKKLPSTRNAKPRPIIRQRKKKMKPIRKRKLCKRFSKMLPNERQRERRENKPPPRAPQGCSRRTQLITIELLSHED